MRIIIYILGALMAAVEFTARKAGFSKREADLPSPKLSLASQFFKGDMHA
jgi:hypothetical protein